MPALGAELGLVLTVLTASSADEIEAVFSTAREKGIGALLIGDDPSFDRRPEQLVAPAARYAAPAMYFRREFAASCGLITYGPIFSRDGAPSRGLCGPHSQRRQTC